MKRLLGLILFLFLVPTLAFAVPTQRDNKLEWTPSTSIDVVGNWLYWDRESNNPRVYDDSKRVNLGSVSLTPSSKKEVVVIDAKPDAESSLCFRVTAYDGVGNESGFSNEACGFFGLISPSLLRTSQ